MEKARDLACHAEMRPAEVRKFCALDDTSRSLMNSAMSQLQAQRTGLSPHLEAGPDECGFSG